MIAAGRSKPYGHLRSAGDLKALVEKAIGSPELLAWLRIVVLLCPDISDFRRLGPDFRHFLEGSGFDVSKTEALMESCLSHSHEAHSVRAFICEELCFLLLQQKNKRRCLKHTRFYEDAGVFACGESSLDLFFADGTYSEAQVSLEIQSSTPCVGYECKVTLRTWLHERDGEFDNECARKLRFMECIARKIPTMSLAFVCLDGPPNCRRAQELLKKHGFQDFVSKVS